MQDKGVAANLDRVTGVVAAREPDAVVNAVTEIVGGLSLAFVAPLGSDHDNSGHPDVLSLGDVPLHSRTAGSIGSATAAGWAPIVTRPSPCPQASGWCSSWWGARRKSSWLSSW
ncbi:Uncharacterised protein [Mycobacteroides abscessus subsp. abscessus]|nr:Uncharacterised protein [Mycobacteroides abscessus subsp. abscessus]